MTGGALLLGLLPVLGPLDRLPTPAETASAKAFLRRFDEVCSTGDRGEVAKLLVPGASGKRGPCESKLLPTVCGLLHRRSELLELRASGEALGAFVRADLERKRSEEGEAREAMRRNEFLLLRQKDGELALAALLDFDPSGLSLSREEALTCEACNWRLVKPPGWFAVYRNRDTCGATEAVTFLPPAGEPAIEFRVFDLLEPCDPLGTTLVDDERFCRQCGHAPAVPETLLRRTFPAGPGLSAAESELRCAPSGRERQRVLRTYFLRDRTLYALVASGCEKGIETIRSEFAGLRASFALREPGRAPEEARRAMLRHNPGGALAGNTYGYEAEGLRLAVRAPQGWRGIETSGPAVFRVRFLPPGAEGGAFLDVYGIRDPAGWTDRGAIAREFEERERELRACGANDLEVSPRSTAPHEGLRTPVHRSTYAWIDRRGRRVRELFLFAPLGVEAVCLAARAEEEGWDRLRPRFEEAVEALGRR